MRVNELTAGILLDILRVSDLLSHLFILLDLFRALRFAYMNQLAITWKFRDQLRGEVTYGRRQRDCWSSWPFRTAIYRLTSLSIGALLPHFAVECSVRICRVMCQVTQSQ